MLSVLRVSNKDLSARILCNTILPVDEGCTLCLRCVIFVSLGMCLLYWICLCFLDNLSGQENAWQCEIIHLCTTNGTFIVDKCADTVKSCYYNILDEPNNKSSFMFQIALNHDKSIKYFSIIAMTFYNEIFIFVIIVYFSE